MIRKKRFNELLLNHSFIKEFPNRLQETIEQQIPLDKVNFKAFKIRLRNSDACMLIVDTELFVFWVTGFLWFKRPHVQIIDFKRINRFKSINSDGLFIHASEHPDIIDENYQAGEYYFKSMHERNMVVDIIKDKAIRLDKF